MPAQGELKLCSYTFESCAAAVLQRRTPRIPHVHLARWFNDGAAGASSVACLSQDVKHMHMEA